MDWFDPILAPIMWVVAWIMVLAHNFFVWLGMRPDGWSWILSIIALVVVIRVILIPLFVKQIKASRGLQIVQPQLQALQKKYKGKTDPASRQAQQQEMMAIYRENGTNPFASCLPILAQSPIFFALFRVLYRLPQIASGEVPAIGPLNSDLAAEAEKSQLFGAPLSSWFLMSPDVLPEDVSLLTVRIVTAILIVAMSLTTFTTQRQLTMKNMPASALDNPMARQQKMMMYLFPLIFAFSGVNFPIGVLIYWTTTNLWSMGQQFYVIRNMPAPGSEAEKKYNERMERKAARRAARGGILPGSSMEDAGVETITTDDATSTLEDSVAGGQRQQPTSKKRAKKKGLPKATPGGLEDTAARAPGSGAGDVTDLPDDEVDVVEVVDEVQDAPPTGGASGGSGTRPGSSSKRSKKSRGPKG